MYTNFNFFYSKMGILPYVWVRWNQKKNNLDMQMSYSYFRDPVWSKRSVKYNPDEYYGFKKLWFPRFLMIFFVFHDCYRCCNEYKGEEARKRSKNKKIIKILVARALSTFFFSVKFIIFTSFLDRLKII